MSVKEVMQWQSDYVRQGNASSAVGKYQIISTTLAGLVRELGLDADQKFDAAMQDRLAIALLERRGAEDYVNKALSRDDFAASLAKEWAALPKVVGENSNDSYYASDGLNKSLVSVDEVRKAIEPIAPK
jgi:muramidase (phage lysozyme)